jgi:hypothetical protein
MVLDDPDLVVDQETSSSQSKPQIVAQDSALGSSVEMSREGSPAFEEIRHPDEATPPMSNSPPVKSTIPTPAAPTSTTPAIQSKEEEEEVSS